MDLISYYILDCCNNGVLCLLWSCSMFHLLLLESFIISVRFLILLCVPNHYPSFCQRCFSSTIRLPIAVRWYLTNIVDRNICSASSWANTRAGCKQVQRTIIFDNILDGFIGESKGSGFVSGRIFNRQVVDQEPTWRRITVFFLPSSCSRRSKLRLGLWRKARSFTAYGRVPA